MAPEYGASWIETKTTTDFAGDLLLIRELNGRGAWTFRCWAGRVHSSHDATNSAGYRGCRGDLISVPCRDLGTVGQVGRSCNAQTADKRASGDYVTFGGRKSALLLLSPTTSIATTASSLFFSASFTTTLHLHQRSSPHFRAADCLQTNPPTFPNGFYDRTPQPGLLPWIDLVERRNGRPKKRDSNVAATGRTYQVDCIAQNCREPESTGQRKRLPSERILKKLSNSSRPPHFRRPTMSNSIPFHSTLRTIPVLTTSPPLFLSPMPLFTAVSIPHLSCAYLSLLPIPSNAANVVASTWNRLRNSFESEIRWKERRKGKR